MVGRERPADRRPGRVAPGRRRAGGAAGSGPRTTGAARSSAGVDLEVRAGEMLGIAGVAGNGQDELVEAITGLRKPSAGTVTLAGADVTGWSPRQLYEAGLAYVPGDRHRWAMVLSFPLEDNLVLTSYYRPPFARGLVRQDGGDRGLGDAS